MELSASLFDRNDMNSLRESLLDLSFHDLIYQTELVMDELRPSDRIQYHISNFCTEYLDRHGRIDFIEAVLKAGLVDISILPFIKKTEEPQKQHQLRGNFFHAPIKKQKQEEQRALTDDLETATTSEIITLSNPRWEHVNEKRNESNSGYACINEKIFLLADVKGVPEGAAIVFDVFDKSSSAQEFRVDGAKGVVKSGVAKAEWIINDPNYTDADCALNLEFEASFKSKASPRAKLVVDEEFLFSI